MTSANFVTAGKRLIVATAFLGASALIAPTTANAAAVVVTDFDAALVAFQAPVFASSNDLAIGAVKYRFDIDESNATFSVGVESDDTFQLQAVLFTGGTATDVVTGDEPQTLTGEGPNVFTVDLGTKVFDEVVFFLVAQGEGAGDDTFSDGVTTTAIAFGNTNVVIAITAVSGRQPDEGGLRLTTGQYTNTGISVFEAADIGTAIRTAGDAFADADYAGPKGLNAFVADKTSATLDTATIEYNTFVYVGNDETPDGTLLAVGALTANTVIGLTCTPSDCATGDGGGGGGETDSNSVALRTNTVSPGSEGGSNSYSVRDLLGPDELFDSVLTSFEYANAEGLVFDEALNAAVNQSGLSAIPVNNLPGPTLKPLVKPFLVSEVFFNAEGDQDDLWAEVNGLALVEFDEIIITVLFDGAIDESTLDGDGADFILVGASNTTIDFADTVPFATDSATVELTLVVGGGLGETFRFNRSTGALESVGIGGAATTITLNLAVDASPLTTALGSPLVTADVPATATDVVAGFATVPVISSLDQHTGSGLGVVDGATIDYVAPITVGSTTGFVLNTNAGATGIVARISLGVANFAATVDTDGTVEVALKETVTDSTTLDLNGDGVVSALDVALFPGLYGTGATGAGLGFAVESAASSSNVYTVVFDTDGEQLELPAVAADNNNIVEDGADPVLVEVTLTITDADDDEGILALNFSEAMLNPGGTEDDANLNDISANGTTLPVLILNDFDDNAAADSTGTLATANDIALSGVEFDGIDGSVMRSLLSVGVAASNETTESFQSANGEVVDAQEVTPEEVGEAGPEIDSAIAVVELVDDELFLTSVIIFLTVDVTASDDTEDLADNFTVNFTAPDGFNPIGVTPASASVLGGTGDVLELTLPGDGIRFRSIDDFTVDFDYEAGIPDLEDVDEEALDTTFDTSVSVPRNTERLFTQTIRGTITTDGTAPAEALVKAYIVRLKSVGAAGEPATSASAKLQIPDLQEEKELALGVGGTFSLLLNRELQQSFEVFDDIISGCCIDGLSRELDEVLEDLDPDFEGDIPDDIQDLDLPDDLRDAAEELFFLMDEVTDDTARFATRFGQIFAVVVDLEDALDDLAIVDNAQELFDEGSPEDNLAFAQELQDDVDRIFDFARVVLQTRTDPFEDFSDVSDAMAASKKRGETELTAFVAVRTVTLRAKIEGSKILSEETSTRHEARLFADRDVAALFGTVYAVSINTGPSSVKGKGKGALGKITGTDVDGQVFFGGGTTAGVDVPVVVGETSIAITDNAGKFRVTVGVDTFFEDAFVFLVVAQPNEDFVLVTTADKSFLNFLPFKQDVLISSVETDPPQTNFATDESSGQNGQTNLIFDLSKILSTEVINPSRNEGGANNWTTVGLPGELLRSDPKEFLMSRFLITIDEDTGALQSLWLNDDSDEDDEAFDLKANSVRTDFQLNGLEVTNIGDTFESGDGLALRNTDEGTLFYQVSGLNALAKTLDDGWHLVTAQGDVADPADFCGVSEVVNSGVLMAIEAGTGRDVRTFIDGTTNNTLNSLEAGNAYFVFLASDFPECDFGG